MSEINKWWKNCPLNFTFTTYISLHKYIGTWDTVIYDEAHIIAELEKGRPIICIMGPGDFTTSGHFEDGEGIT